MENFITMLAEDLKIEKEKVAEIFWYWYIEGCNNPEKRETIIKVLNKIVNKK